jgi:hypothetical protein
MLILIGETVLPKRRWQAKSAQLATVAISMRMTPIGDFHTGEVMR